VYGKKDWVGIQTISDNMKDDMSLGSLYQQHGEMLDITVDDTLIIRRYGVREERDSAAI
jgi:hypothetical protein